MKKTAIPTSKATTAYDLLAEICTLIRAEPKRYAQNTWIIRRNREHDGLARKGFPACGTVGCVAGWIATLKGPKHFDYLETRIIAEDILGGCTRGLFSALSVSGPPQTLKHARAGVAHIRRFMNRHAKRLKATSV